MTSQISTQKRKRIDDQDGVNQELETSSIKVTLLYPITRYYSEVFASVEFDELPTKKSEIMKFYKTKISEQDRKIICDAYKNDPRSDLDGSISCNILEYADDEPVLYQNLKYKELMNGLVFYEGLEKVKDNVYEVRLGS